MNISHNWIAIDDVFMQSIDEKRLIHYHARHFPQRPDNNYPFPELCGHRDKFVIQFQDILREDFHEV
ncbi:hypothetical protein [Alkalihalophilus marmarensis]|uniref:hypothetical protein n=1 Tax=Alkalihalophilus marmarensis TaxID=521377 RepID=UPI002DB7A0B0|nr:hypothetical protein [Alkalihalophilus marmarensis]MEC2073756.1 hypothetical protein [Alkalihalophilus marmarensis]